MTRPLTAKQQLAKIKTAVALQEQAANTLIAVKCGKDTDLARMAEVYQGDILSIAQSLKWLHDQWERAMEERNGE